MAISFYRLWRLLERRDFEWRDIIRLATISKSTYRKLLTGDNIRMDVLERVCDALYVDIGDVCSIRK